MKRQDLVAPEWYNIVEEIEKYAQDAAKNALIIYEENQDIQCITYAHLLEKANQAAHVFTKQGLKKGDVILVMVPRSVEARILSIEFIMQMLKQLLHLNPILNSSIKWEIYKTYCNLS